MSNYTKNIGSEFNMNNGEGGNLKRPTQIVCKLLALLATSISLSLLAVTGWQLGESSVEKMILMGFGILPVLGAHLLLSLCGKESINVRLVAIVLWLFCMTYVAFNHASYFLLSQQQAGIRRVALVDQSLSKAEPVRNLTAIASDRAKIKTELAIKSQIRCGNGCVTLRAKVTSLQATLDALEAEADDVRRWHLQQDRQIELQDRVRDDPVMMQLANWFGVTAMQMGLVKSFLFSVILEGLACLCWYMGLQSRDSAVPLTVTPPVTQLVTVVSDLQNNGSVDYLEPCLDLDNQVEEFVQEVKAGRLKVTVNSVREYFHCGQEKARKLRQLVGEKLNADAQAC